MVNVFGFITIDAIMGIFAFMLLGLFTGFMLGFARFAIFAFVERRMRWSTWGDNAS